MTPTKEEAIKAIEDEIFKTQKNKATEHHIGKLKAKLAYLRIEIEKQRGSGAKGKGFAVKKSGDATVGIIGYPSIGKSTLLNQLTDASSKVGDYDFTTLDAIPGMMNYKGARIQFLDLPGLISGASKGRGRGREILSAVRSVDLLLLMIDAREQQQLTLIERELTIAGLRLNQRKPDVVVRKTGRGGITVNTTMHFTHLDEPLIKTIASEFLINADIVIREDLSEDQLIDVFSQNRIYVPALVVINKTDLVSEKLVEQTVSMVKRKKWEVISIAAKQGMQLDHLRERIYTLLQFIRIYLKPMGKNPDYTEPMVLRQGDTVGIVCRHIHRDLERKFRYAQIWGPSAKHPGQKVGLEHKLHDEDILTLVISR